MKHRTLPPSRGPHRPGQIRRSLRRAKALLRRAFGPLVPVWDWIMALWPQTQRILVAVGTIITFIRSCKGG